MGVLDGQRQDGELGKELVQDGQAQVFLQAQRRARRFQQQAQQLVGDALGAQPAQRHLARLGVDGLVDGEVVAGGEAGGAQDAQRVVAEAGRRGHGDAPPGDGLQPAMGIDDRPVGQAHGDGVAGEVAPPQVLLQGDLGPGLHLDVPVAVGAPLLLAVAARQGDVEGPAPAAELDHREALAHRVGLAVPAQARLDLVVAQPGHQQVDVLLGNGLAVEDAVAHRAADDVGVPAEHGDEKVLLGEIDAQPLHIGSILAGCGGEVNSVIRDS